MNQVTSLFVFFPAFRPSLFERCVPPVFLFVLLDDEESSGGCKIWFRRLHSSSLIRPIRRNIPDVDGIQ